MNKELIDLQRESKATCAIILTEEVDLLSPKVTMKANVSDKFLLKNNKPPFAEKINLVSKKNNICYFIITEIDEISIEQQNRYEGLVKDREMNGYVLPNNCIIVFTVKDKNNLKNVSSLLYRFSVIAF